MRRQSPEQCDALKTFAERIQTAFPRANFSLTDPFAGNDIGLELILPVTQITREERMNIAELAAIEEEPVTRHVIMGLHNVSSSVRQRSV